MKLTIEHVLFKIFLLMFNGIVIIVLIGLIIQDGLNINLPTGVLVLIIGDYYIIKVMKKLRTLIYNDGNLISIKYDKTEEPIELNSIRSIELTGGRISSFYFYKVVYQASERTTSDFLIAPLRNRKFDDFLSDLKAMNTQIRIKRTYP